MESRLPTNKVIRTSFKKNHLGKTHKYCHATHPNRRLYKAAIHSKDGSIKHQYVATRREKDYLEKGYLEGNYESEEEEIEERMVFVNSVTPYRSFAGKLRYRLENTDGMAHFKFDHAAPGIKPIGVRYKIRPCSPTNSRNLYRRASSPLPEYRDRELVTEDEADPDEEKEEEGTGFLTLVEESSENSTDAHTLSWTDGASTSGMSSQIKRRREDGHLNIDTGEDDEKSIQDRKEYHMKLMKEWGWI